MTVIRPQNTAVAATTNTGGAPAVPTWLAGLVAVHPAIADHYKKDPGLRAFLDANRANLVDSGLPAGAVKDSVTWETWCHATSNVPVAERDQEYVVVVARGSAYKKIGRAHV